MDSKDRTQSEPQVRSSELVVPHQASDATEPCVLCSGNGWRKVWFQGRLEERTCCDCHGKGVRPVRHNEKGEPQP